MSQPDQIRQSPLPACAETTDIPCGACWECERAMIVKWLREKYAEQSAHARKHDYIVLDDWEDAADLIEVGEHRA